MLHAVIMAGGSGTRFWPESRAARPKQLLPILGGRAMVAETALRLDPLVPPERTWVVTNRLQVAGVRAACPELPAGNIIVEPCARNTAACVGLAAVVVAAQDPDAVMAVLPADHLISPAGQFQRALQAAAEAAAEPGALVTFGIPPTYPATGYGYIRRGERLPERLGLRCSKVLSFTEKPDQARARGFLASGDYFWNSGIFAWRADTLLAAIDRHMPALGEGLKELAAALGGPGFDAALEALYPGFEALPVDVGIMERADGAVVLETPFHWSDVGSWKAVYDELEHDRDGNAAVFPNGGSLVAQDAGGVLAYSSEPQTIAVIGVDDIVVVRTGDAILVAARDRTEEVKDLIERLQAEGRTELL
ncbi:MAG: NTP transferase domain-containing protein [Planctomycetes bacterium]|nr:NTP transferase domain-containing protein [Planctomycetota bacterium]